jgi:hypothetical protein
MGSIVQYKGTRPYADLAADRNLATEREGEKIIVEIKTFAALSLFSDLEKALGQYFIYQQPITETEPEYKLYVAFLRISILTFFKDPQWN